MTSQNLTWMGKYLLPFHINPGNFLKLEIPISTLFDQIFGRYRDPHRVFPKNFLYIGVIFKVAII